MVGMTEVSRSETSVLLRTGKTIEKQKKGRFPLLTTSGFASAFVPF